MNVFHFKTDAYFGELVGDVGSNVQQPGASTPGLEAKGAVT